MRVVLDTNISDFRSHDSTRKSGRHLSLVAGSAGITLDILCAESDAGRASAAADTGFGKTSAWLVRIESQSAIINPLRSVR